MISAIDFNDIPDIEQPVHQKRPESAFAKRQMREFLDSELGTAEVLDIPAAYNITRLYQSLKNAAWTMRETPHECVKVMRRGSRIFLIRHDSPWQRRR